MKWSLTPVALGNMINISAEETEMRTACNTANKPPRTYQCLSWFDGGMLHLLAIHHMEQVLESGVRVAINLGIG